MRIWIDNIANLKTIIPACVVSRKIYQDEETEEWIYEEICHSSEESAYFWVVKKFGFVSEEELESYIVLHMLESM
jgi:hypothetical protein